MRLLISALSGGLFGFGLYVSGMVDTAKVQGFLDVAGAWDPTLAFVLVGAILPMAIAWRIAGPRSLTGEKIPAPAPPVIDARLIGGAALFGAGWALVGLCPGPSMAVLLFGGWPALVFFAALVAGMWSWKAVSDRRAAALA